MISEDGLLARGLYLWQDRAAAERVYDAEWRARLRAVYGAEPAICWFCQPGQRR
jgi:hypothetical protein